jgi:protein-S-isoprenylcysteine O-methyltransferase Ste14
MKKNFKTHEIQETQETRKKPDCNLMKVASFFGFVLLVLAVIVLVLEESILAHGLIGIAVQILAVLLMLWARFTLGFRSFHATAGPTEGGLVTSGPYRFIRHPIYASIFFFIWSAVLSHCSWETLLIGIVATFAIGLRIWLEERLLVERYPEYVAYSARTKRIIPFLI